MAFDGFGNPFAQYDYRPGEVLVLETAQSVKEKSESNEKGGDVQPIKDLKKSDFGSALRSSSASYQKKLEKENRKELKRNIKKARRDAILQSQIYIPKTPESIAAYGQFTSTISDIIGGVPDDVLHQSAYELLALLRTPNLNEETRVNGIRSILCVSPDHDAVSVLNDLAQQMTDFVKGEKLSLKDAEDDEDGIVSITEDANPDDSDDDSSYSSDDDDNGALDENKIKIPTEVLANSGAWDLKALTNYCEERFPNSSGRGVLDNILTILRNYDGTNLEMELIRVLGMEALSEIQAISKGKDLILGTDKRSETAREKLDFEKLSFDNGKRVFKSTMGISLPEGSETKTDDKRVEVHVPAPKLPVDENGRPQVLKVIPVSEIDDIYKAALAGIDQLNGVQTEVYPVIHNSNQNLLVAAPTGAGKTIIAILCMMKVLMSDKENNKVVYIAPMKSLVQEMVGNFTKRLENCGKRVVELTGDSAASKAQLQHYDVIVTTPEKWDIITRKVGAMTLLEKIGLMIVDEVHLLDDDRGPVLEAIVARAKRTIQVTRHELRIIGLSATMPNYQDIAEFLNVKPSGLKVFNECYRPCPLEKTFVGFKSRSGLEIRKDMNDMSYTICKNNVSKSAQVIVFVHSRRETAETAKFFVEKARDSGDGDLFFPPNSGLSETIIRECENIHNAQLKEVLISGFAFHNAGLDRNDREYVESFFAQGLIKVLVSTATLAWGVNLPAHTVIIKGTRVYNPERSEWDNLSQLDVLQMFGRAGRPNLDTRGEAFLMTEHSELQGYISILNQQMPIESHFLCTIANHMNAEISLGSISNMNEAVEWLSNTYFYVRMQKDPKLYHLVGTDADSINSRCLDIIHTAALDLHEKRLIIYNEKTGNFKPTNLSTIASNYYITPETMKNYAQNVSPNMSDIDILRLFCLSDEFKHISVRPEEVPEVAKLIEKVPVPIKGKPNEAMCKINVLLQCYICRIPLRGFSLMADLVYISQSAERLMRCILELALSSGLASTSMTALSYAKMVGRRMWDVQLPLRQFPNLPQLAIVRLERRNFEWERFFDLSRERLGELASVQTDRTNPKLADKKSARDLGHILYVAIHKFPRITIKCEDFHMMTPTIMSVVIDVQAEFDYDEEIHLQAEPFWIFLIDGDGHRIIYKELFLIKSERDKHATIKFATTAVDEHSEQDFYFVKVVSDRWINCEAEIALPIVKIKHAIDEKTQEVVPLPKKCKLPEEVTIYKEDDVLTKFVEFTRERKHESVLLCSPVNTCDKPIKAVIDDAISSGEKVAVIVPVMAKFRRIAKQLSEKGFSILSGDKVHDERIMETQKLVVGHYSMFSTLTEFDFRLAKNASFNTVILYDMHLSGSDVYQSYDMFISLMRSMSIDNPYFRIIGLSICLDDPGCVAQWIGAKSIFTTSVTTPLIRFRPMSFDFPTSRSRLLAMSRPTFSRCAAHSDTIVFVSSVKQVYTTVAELTSLAKASSSNPNVFNKGRETPEGFADNDLKICTKDGIAFWYDGVSEADKELIMSSFGKSIGVIVALIDCVWEIDIRAECVILKGTDRYDEINHTHTEYQLFEIIEAMGKVYEQCEFCMFMHAPKKSMYIPLLQSGYPIESVVDSATIVDQAFYYKLLQAAKAVSHSAHVLADIISERGFAESVHELENMANDFCVAISTVNYAQPEEKIESLDATKMISEAALALSSKVPGYDTPFSDVSAAISKLSQNARIIAAAASDYLKSVNDQEGVSIAATCDKAALELLNYMSVYRLSSSGIDHYFRIFINASAALTQALRSSPELAAQSQEITKLAVEMEFAIAGLCLNQAGKIIQNASAANGVMTFFLTSSLISQRLTCNHVFYGDEANVQYALSDIIYQASDQLQAASALAMDEEAGTMSMFPLGQIAARYGIDPTTAKLLFENIDGVTEQNRLIDIIVQSYECSEAIKLFPGMIASLVKSIQINKYNDKPTAKAAYVIIMAHLNREELPLQYKELKRYILTMFLRTLSAAVEISCLKRFMNPAYFAVILMQCITQALNFGSCDLLQLPYFTADKLQAFAAQNIHTIDELIDACSNDDDEEADKQGRTKPVKEICDEVLGLGGSEDKWQEICDAANRVPYVSFNIEKNENIITATITRDIEEDEEVDDVKAPLLPFAKSEAWWVVLVDEPSAVAFAAKKVYLERQSTVNFIIGRDISQEDAQKTLKISFLCDSYIGRDVSQDV